MKLGNSVNCPSAGMFPKKWITKTRIYGVNRSKLTGGNDCDKVFNNESTKVNQCEIPHFIYFQESRFGSLNVVFVEKRSFIDS